MKTGIEFIAQERKEQIEKHGFDVKQDQCYKNGELKQAAMYCLTLDEKYYPTNWGIWFKQKIQSKRLRLSEQDFEIEMDKIAGAFIAANIDRTIQI